MNDTGMPDHVEEPPDSDGHPAMDWDAQPLGRMPDVALAKLLGVSPGRVGDERQKRRIPVATTCRVRIAVAVTYGGDYWASGFPRKPDETQETHDLELLACAAHPDIDGPFERVSFIEVDVPLPKRNRDPAEGAPTSPIEAHVSDVVDIGDWHGPSES